MKYRFVLFLVFSIGAAPVVSGQDFNYANTDQKSIEKPNEIPNFYWKINPLTILQGPIPLTSEFRVGFEGVVSPRFTYQLAASLLTKSIFFNAIFPDSGAYGLTGDDFAFPGYRAQGQLKYYFLKFNQSDEPSQLFVPNGMYVALHGSYSYANLHIKSFRAQGVQFGNFNVNALVGVQVMSSANFGLDFFTGFGFKNNRIFFMNDKGEIEDLDPTDFSAYYGSSLKISLGMNFTFVL